MSKRKLASNLVLFLFLILVSVAALLSDIFQNPVKTGAQIIEQAKLFASSDLEQIQRLSLKNKSGEYIFERNKNNQISPWHMVAPRDISADSLFIEKLFKSLNVMKVKKLFPDEKINNSNFSLDRPTATLTLTDKNGKNLILTMGLLNSIDNSTYLKIQGRPGIYHVEAPSVSLENANILDLIESQIIAINQEMIVAFKIFRGNKKAGPPLLDLKKDNGKWTDSEGTAISAEKIDDYFQDLSNLKSSFIVERPTDSQKRQINNLAHNSVYIISIVGKQGNTIDYNFSGLVRSISDIDLKSEEYFVMTISNSATAYVVKKEFLDLFNRKTENLKATVLTKPKI
ncbi:MAG: DUF4340 domain-containing protein [Bacteriovorax sp.]